MRVHRTHVDDRAAAAGLDHGFHAGARGEEGAIEVDGEHLLPIGQAQLDHGADDLDAGIGNQHVHAAELLDGVGDTLVDLFFVGDVHSHGQGLAAGIGDFLDSGIAGFERKVGDHDLGAFSRVLQGDFLADAAGCTGDERDFVFQ